MSTHCNANPEKSQLSSVLTTGSVWCDTEQSFSENAIHKEKQNILVF